MTAIARNCKDAIARDLASMKISVQHWLEDMATAANTLTAAFRDASYSRSWRQDFVDELAGDLSVEVKSGYSFARKMIRIVEAAEKSGFNMDGWQEIKLKLKAIADEADRQDAGLWQTAGIARRILQQ